MNDFKVTRLDGECYEILLSNQMIGFSWGTLVFPSP